MELKEAEIEVYPLECNGDYWNPFNGIESFVNIADCVIRSTYSNPFNGIERCNIEGIYRDDLVANPFNGIESSSSLSNIKSM